MRRIDREWLRRVPGYEEGGNEKLRRRRVSVPGAGGEEGPAPDAEQEEQEGEEQAAADAESSEDPPDGNADGDADGAKEAATTDDAEGPPENGDPDGGGEQQQRRDAEPPGLSIPDEVEQARREREAKERHGERNPALAPKAFGLEGRYMRGLAARFARMVSKVAEDSADMPSQGDEEWDLVELRQRRFTGRLIGQCRMTREKRKVAVVLDTSPSCEHQARLFAAIARVAEELGDCELYDAPNFAIHAVRLRTTWETLREAEREWNFQGRVVLAFGDFDGIQRISQASSIRGNKIYWFCCEERPTVLESERDYFVAHFKGHYLPATNLQNLMKAMRKVR